MARHAGRRHQMGAVVRSAVVHIDLPRPRDFKMMSSPEAYGYKRMAMEILHEEAMKSFVDQAGASGFMEAYSKANA